MPCDDPSLPKTVIEIDKNLKFFKDRNIQLSNPEQGMLNSARKVDIDDAEFFDFVNEENN